MQKQGEGGQAGAPRPWAYSGDTAINSLVRGLAHGLRHQSPPRIQTRKFISGGSEGTKQGEGVARPRTEGSKCH